MSTLSHESEDTWNNPHKALGTGFGPCDHSLVVTFKTEERKEGDFVQSKSTQPWSVSSGQAVLLVTVYLKGLCQG